jgi:mannose-1-phosphate guanylyltransferase
MEIHPVIMAGGSGTRFWPLSRKKKPKQFLPIISAKTMIEETVERLLPLVDASCIYTIANSEQTATIRDLIPGIPSDNLLVEPQGKNTAPSLILATATIFQKNENAVVAALPADHLIQDPSQFLKKLEAAARMAFEKDHLITFGITPNHPATGYGYIQFSADDWEEALEERFYNVLGFREKPDLDTARKFCESGNYSWNSGMFLWKASVFRDKLERYAPDIFPFWKEISKAIGDHEERKIGGIFDRMPSVSIDYALMEKARGVLMGKGDFGWSDVGAWSALGEVWPTDDRRNAVRGKSILIDAKGCLVYNPQKLTALIGVEDLIVVDTPDSLLICRKDLDQKVKAIVQSIEKKKEDRYL